MQQQAYLSIIPLGLCQCGCGQKTNRAAQNYPLKGIVRGQPNRYLHGHAVRTLPPCYGLRPVGSTARIPVFSSTGVAAQTVIDAEDWALATSRRWRFNQYGYVRAGDSATTHVFLHRLILGLSNGDGQIADHINGDPLDNRRGNLRLSSPLLNAQNKSPLSRGTSRYRGVCWAKDTQRWQASATADGKQHYLGQYDDELEAARVAAAFRAEHMPHSRELAAID